MTGAQHSQLESGCLEKLPCTLKRDEGLFELFADHQAPAEGEDGPRVVRALGGSSGKEPPGNGLGAERTAITPGEKTSVGWRRRIHRLL